MAGSNNHRLSPPPEENFACAFKVKDRVGFQKSLRNKIRTLSAYTDKKSYKVLNTREDLLRAVLNANDAIAPNDGLVERASKLWLFERIIREARKFDNGVFLLRESSIEKHLPILHVGWGMDSFAEAKFDYERLMKTICSSAHPRYRLLALEPAGAVYLACRGSFKARLFGLKTTPLPCDKKLDSFFERFSEPEIDIMSHGLGRSAYFQALTLDRALKLAQNCARYFNPAAAVRGVAFAYTMINTPDLNSVYSTAEDMEASGGNEGLSPIFLDGIASALSFLEWNFPGALKGIGDHRITRNAVEMFERYLAAGGVFSL